MKFAKEIALWAVGLLLVYGFARAGIMKFSATSGWARAFMVDAAGKSMLP